MVNVPWCHKCDDFAHSGPCENAAPQPASEPAQPAEGVSDAVVPSHVVDARAMAAYHDAARTCRFSHDCQPLGCCDIAGLRAAFAAADLVPRAELEAMRAERDIWRERSDALAERAQSAAAATARAEAAERERDAIGVCIKTLDGVLGAIGTACQEALGEEVRPMEVQPLVADVLERLEAAEAERDAAQAKLAYLGTREAAERVTIAYHRERATSDEGCMHRALRRVLDQPAPRAETARDLGAELDALREAFGAVVEWLEGDLCPDGRHECAVFIRDALGAGKDGGR